jgi:hypothetical protein
VSRLTEAGMTGVSSWTLTPPRSPRLAYHRSSLPAPLPPPTPLPPTAPPVIIANLVTPPTTANSSAAAPPSPKAARPEFDNEIRLLLAKSNEKAQREQAERREVDAWVVAVVSRLDEIERHRQLLDDRTEALESRVTQVEHVTDEQAHTTDALAREVDDRLTAVERRQARRRAFSWWAGPTETSIRPTETSIRPTTAISPTTSISPAIPD